MIIQKIELENYKPYYGKQVIDLSVDQRHNVILIEGDNDTGKTSLFQALRFCLYGEAHTHSTTFTRRSHRSGKVSHGKRI